MKIVALKEEKEEKRAAIVPKFVQKFKSLGFDVEVETGIGEGIDISDEEYIQAGAQIKKRKELLKDADIIIKVNKPSLKDIELFKPKAIYISFLDPFYEKDLIDTFLQKDITALSMHLIVRTTLAQKMDALSSQANLAGYSAIIYGAKYLNKILPMMTTPAGTISPSKVFIIGAGVAGLQAIATARRLGANVEAFDTRAETEEQIKSLGAKFVKADIGKTESTKAGYAKELTKEQLNIQREAMKKAISTSDIVVTTAQVFGRKAPVIITEDMLKDIKTPTLIIDMAIITGGNVEGSEKDKIIKKGNVTILAPSNLTNEVALDASTLYSSNLFSLIEHFYDKETKKLKFDLNDEIIKTATLTHSKKLITPILTKGK
ncbi:MAG TPA: NAD(P) transhydrogenase subunit alpha [Chlamydiae bacterium]|nr:NAD(P) transhydrogenase subunit alpha part 1 [Candidatus Anoxychlamydiales bacterium]HEU64169.1 NAD(P) transhydrogenase subunit alpha [Chlamydiota bacterium]